MSGKPTEMSVKIGGTALSDDAMHSMQSVVVRDSLEHIDSVEVAFILPGGSGEAVAKEVAKYGDEMLVELKLDGTAKRTVGGDIVAVSWSQHREGDRMVTVTALDPRHRLRKPRQTTKANDRRYVGKTASDIVKDIAQSWKLGVDAQSTNATIKSFQHYGDDASIIKHLADENGYIMRIDVESGSPKLIFARREAPVGGSTVELDFTLDLMDLSFEHDLSNIVTSVKVAGFNPITDEDPVYTEAKKSVLSPLNDKTGIDYVSGTWGDFPEVISETDGARGMKSETKDKAEGILRARAMTFVNGRAVTYFRPDVRSGGKVKIKNGGWPFDGIYVVKEAHHIFEMGEYRSEFHLMADSIASP